MTRHLLRFAVLFWLLCPQVVLAVTVYAPEVSTQPGETITVPVMIDNIGNLAGLKLVLTYDDAVLTYAGGAKTPISTSLMHIVNDRQPGRLVLVMAGARGIGGERIAVFELRFTASKNIGKKTLTELSIVESQLMSDALKDIQHDTKRFRVAVVPASAPAAAASMK